MSEIKENNIASIPKSQRTKAIIVSVTIAGLLIICITLTVFLVIGCNKLDETLGSARAVMGVLISKGILLTILPLIIQCCKEKDYIKAVRIICDAFKTVYPEYKEQKRNKPIKVKKEKKKDS